MTHRGRYACKLDIPRRAEPQASEFIAAASALILQKRAILGHNPNHVHSDKQGRYDPRTETAEISRLSKTCLWRSDSPDAHTILQTVHTSVHEQSCCT
jgi:hypothetical protein